MPTFVRESPTTPDRRSCRASLSATTLLSAAALLFASGCYRTQISSKPIQDLVYERRTPTDPEQEFSSSHWQKEGRRVTGKIEWASCRVERKTSRSLEITTRREPDRLAGYLFVGGGVLAAAVGIAAWGASGSGACASGGCSREHNSAWLVLGLGSGLGSAGVGAATLLGKTKTKVEVTDRKEEEIDEVGPCIQAGDFADLSLALRAENGAELAVRVSEDGSAVIDIPPGVDLPHGVDLPIWVQRVPRHAGDVLKRMQVIGTVRVEGDATDSNEAP
jgi:hypothetical protein